MENVTIEGSFHTTCSLTPASRTQCLPWGSPCQKQHQLWMSFYSVPPPPPPPSPADSTITSCIFSRAGLLLINTWGRGSEPTGQEDNFCFVFHSDECIRGFEFDLWSHIELRIEMHWLEMSHFWWEHLVCTVLLNSPWRGWNNESIHQLVHELENLYILSLSSKCVKHLLILTTRIGCLSS